MCRFIILFGIDRAYCHICNTAQLHSRNLSFAKARSAFYQGIEQSEIFGIIYVLKELGNGIISVFISPKVIVYGNHKRIIVGRINRCALVQLTDIFVGFILCRNNTARIKVTVFVKALVSIIDVRNKVINRIFELCRLFVIKIIKHIKLIRCHFFRQRLCRRNSIKPGGAVLSVVGNTYDELIVNERCNQAVAHKQ